MPQSSICRMCLGTDIRMFPIVGTPLQAVYEKITEAELLDNMKPVAACYICHAQLRRCRMFMERSVKADELLTGILMTNKLTMKSVARIDRKSYNLIHPLSIKVQKPEDQLEIDVSKVKKETEFEFAGAEDNGLSFDDHSDFPQIGEPIVQLDDKTFEQPDSETIAIEFLKEEEKECDELNEPAGSPAEDNIDPESDDEPLRPPKTKFRRKRAKKDNDSENLPSQEKDKKSTRQPKQKKRGAVPNVETSEGNESKCFFSLEHVKIKNRRRYVCQFCKKIFVNKSHMRCHLITHTGEKPFNCIHCTASFNRVYHLKRHMRTHTGEMPYKCNQCKRRFPREDNLKTHIKTHNQRDNIKREKYIKTEKNTADFGDLKPYVCRVCGCAFTRNKDLKEHSVEHTGGVFYECDYCHRMFVRKCDLRIHVLRHIDGSKLECDICRLKFTKQNQLNDHLKTHALEAEDKFNLDVSKSELNVDKQYQCNECGARFARNYHLKRHLLLHAGDAIYECIFCHCKFNQKYNLRLHLKTHTKRTIHACDVCKRKFPDKEKLDKHMGKHIKGETLSIYDLKPFLCSLCGLRFCRRYHLNRHLQTHNNATIYECEFCASKFVERTSLKLHLKTHASEKLFECEICQRKFMTKVSLQRHMEKHNDDSSDRQKVKRENTSAETIVCTLCGIVLNRKYDFKRHMIQHTGEKPYECNICQKRFTQSCSLRAHLKRHTGIKPFECKICHHRFYEKTNLVTHMTKHSDEKPHECEVCNRKFKRKDVMIMHKKIHSNEKPHECHICLRSFALKKTMKKHLNTHRVDKVEASG